MLPGQKDYLVTHQNPPFLASAMQKHLVSPSSAHSLPQLSLKSIKVRVYIKLDLIRGINPAKQVSLKDFCYTISRPNTATYPVSKNRNQRQHWRKASVPPSDHFLNSFTFHCVHHRRTEPCTRSTHFLKVKLNKRQPCSKGPGEVTRAWQQQSGPSRCFMLLREREEGPECTDAGRDGRTRTQPYLYREGRKPAFGPRIWQSLEVKWIIKKIKMKQAASRRSSAGRRTRALHTPLRHHCAQPSAAPGRAAAWAPRGQSSGAGRRGPGPGPHPAGPGWEEDDDDEEGRHATVRKRKADSGPRRAGEGPGAGKGPGTEKKGWGPERGAPRGSAEAQGAPSAAGPRAEP